MNELQQAFVQNRLLKSLSPADFELLRPGLEELSLNSGHGIAQANEPMSFVYFPEQGIISVTQGADPHLIEIGIIGREGFVGGPLLLGVDTTPHKVFVQVPGRFLRIGVNDFLAAVAESPTLRALLLRYVHAFMLQIASTAAANASLTLEGRLARWLLMCNDRLDGDDVALTHEFLAMMLCVRRPGVTVATHMLEGNHLIRARRGCITIRDRTRLQELTDDTYGSAEAEYERLVVAVSDPKAAALQAGEASASKH